MAGFGACGDLAFGDAAEYAYPHDVLGDERAGVRFITVAEIYPVNLGAEGVEASATFPIGDLALDDESATEPLYLASEEWATRPSDVPGNQPFDGKLREFRFGRSLLSGSRFGGLVLGSGTLTFDNADGAYDSFVTGYALDGRRVVVKMGRSTDAYDSFVTLFDGTARDWRGTLASVEVILRDNGFRLDVPAQPDTYAGSGADAGGDDLAGKRKPLLLGLVEHGPLAAVDPANLVYQANDGAIDGAIEVLDQGIALTPGGAPQANYAALVAHAVAAGEFEVCPSGGFVKLGATPGGQVTFRAAEGFGIATTAELVRKLVEPSLLLDPQEIDADSFDALDAAQPADVGIFFGADASPTVADAVADVLAGAGAFGAFDRLGKLFVRRVEPPGGATSDVFTQHEVIALDRDALPATLSPPPWRMRTTYQRNFAPLSGGDLSGAVAPADRTALQGESLVASASDPDIAAQHLLAQDLAPERSFFAAKADAEDEAERLLFLFAAGRALWRAQLPRRALLVELGRPIDVAYPRYGLADGRAMTAVELTMTVGARSVQAEVVAYG